MGLKEDFLELPPSKCLLAGFLLCVVYYFLIFDKGERYTTQIQGVQAEINDKNTRLAEVQKAMGNKNAFEQEVKALEKDFIDLLKFFPVRLDMNDIQRDITTILNKSDTKIVSIKESTVQNRFDGYLENGIDLEINSDFHQIMSFLSEITKMNKVVDFRAMDFISNNSNAESSHIKFRMQFSIFAQDPNYNKKANPAGGK
jgi:Tfp pilus assembly protein PilO